jgi:hypothetical protein
MSSLVRTFEGSCHCGALGFSFQTQLPVTEWSVRACQCGFCRAHRARTTSDPTGRLVFHVKQAEALQRYRFGLMTADFLLCRTCGIYLGAQIATARGAYGIINTLALVPPPEGLPTATNADYGSEKNARDRIARREQRWTPLARLA